MSVLAISFLIVARASLPVDYSATIELVSPILSLAWSHVVHPATIEPATSGSLASSGTMGLVLIAKVAAVPLTSHTLKYCCVLSISAYHIEPVNLAAGPCLFAVTIKTIEVGSFNSIEAVPRPYMCNTIMLRYVSCCRATAIYRIGNDALGKDVSPECCELGRWTNLVMNRSRIDFGEGGDTSISICNLEGSHIHTSGVGVGGSDLLLRRHCANVRLNLVNGTCLNILYG